MSYVLRINHKSYHTGIALLPKTTNIINAKQYHSREQAFDDAVYLTLNHKGIAHVEVVNLTKQLQHAGKEVG